MTELDQAREAFLNMIADATVWEEDIDGLPEQTRVRTMPVFYEIATLNNPAADEPYAVIRIDTDRPMGGGVEGVVVSHHWTRDEAKAAADLALSEPHGRA